MSRPVRLDPSILDITEHEILSDLSWPFRLPGDWKPERPPQQAADHRPRGRLAT